jgi:nitric oxide reductase large subunit
VAIGFVGGLVKESIVLLWPVALAQCAISRRRDARTVAAVLLFPVGFALSSALCRALATTRGDYTFWKGLNLLENLSRGRVYVAAALSLGLQGLFALLALPHLRRMATEERRRYLPLVVGALGSLALFGFALVTAHADGRFLWLGHPFLTPLAALGARTLVTELSRRRSLRTAGPSPRY